MRHFLVLALMLSTWAALPALDAASLGKLKAATIRVWSPTGFEGQGRLWGSGLVVARNGDACYAVIDPIMAKYVTRTQPLRVFVGRMDGSAPIMEIVSELPAFGLALGRFTHPAAVVQAVALDGGPCAIGDQVFAIGFPFGGVNADSTEPRAAVTATVTGGRISIIDGGVDGGPASYRSDFDLAPGMRGAPVADQGGKVVGVVLPAKRRGELSSVAPAWALRKLVDGFVSACVVCLLYTSDAADE